MASNEEPGSTALTNGQILDELQSKNQAQAARFVKNLYPGNDASLSSFEKAIGKIKSTRKKLLKDGRRGSAIEKLNIFLASEFSPPKCTPNLRKRKTSGLCPAHSVCAFEAEAKKVAGESAEKSVDLASKDAALASKEMALEKEVACSEKLRRGLKRSRDREDYQRKKNKKLEEKINHDECEDQICQLEEEVKALKEELSELKESNKDLERKVRAMEQEDEVIETYDHGKRCFNTALTNCVYELLNNHVGVAKVSGVIKSVIHHLTGKECSRLPSKTTVENMSVQRLCVAQDQLSAELASEQDTTLYTDETSKFGDKVMGYHASTSDNRYYVLGLRDIATKSAADTLKTFKELLQDIDDACIQASSGGKKILSNIRNTMSDRAATELKWHELLRRYRMDVLPTIKENWEAMSEDERAPLGKITSFFCGLHSLVQYAETCEKVLDSVEKELTEGKGGGAKVKGLALQSEGCGVLRLVKGCSKAFSRGGSEKAGVHGHFKLFVQEFLKSNGFRTLPLVPFKGNRFNILFFNAGYVYFLHDHMKRFIDGFGATNKLLKCVQADLAEPLYLAGCRALGLISKIITAPLWRCLEDGAAHILDLPEVYQKLEDTLKRGSEHPQEFMEGSIQPLEDVEEDAIFKVLIQPCENDGLTAIVLQNMLPALCKVMAAHNAHITEVSKDERETSKSVAKHNKFPERVFAYLDQQMRTRPNTSLLVHEATIMFSLNKTGDWLKSLTSQEAEELICSARKRARNLHSLFKERSEIVRQQKMKALEEREREKERKEEKRRLDLEHFTQEIHYYGLWQSEREVDEMLNTLSTPKQKLNALKAQLRFRQHVLRQVHPRPEVFSFSMKGVAHTWEVLSANVKTLVHQAFTLPSTSSPEAELPLLVGKRLHKADNLLKGDSYKKWTGGNEGEKQVSVILQLEKASIIHSIDIGNESSAFVEILGGHSTSDSEDYQVILVTSSFMSPVESRNNTNTNRVRMFGPESLSKAVADKKFDRIKIVCTQPFNKRCKYGLSFIKLHGPPSDQQEKTTGQSPQPSTKRRLSDADKREAESNHKKPAIEPKKEETRLQEPVSKKAKESKPQPATGEAFGKLMKKVVFVLSGFQNPLRGELRQKAMEMGAKYQGDWGPGATHLICAFANTPKYNQVKGKGKIVKKEWITESYRKRVLLPWRRYKLGGGQDSSSEESESEEEEEEKEEVTPVKPTPSKSPQAKPSTPKKPEEDDDDDKYGGSTDEEGNDTEPISGGGSSGYDTEDEIRRAQGKPKTQTKKGESPSKKGQSSSPGKTSQSSSPAEIPDLPDFFSNKRFFLFGKFDSEERRQVNRFIIAFNGLIENYMNETVNYVITNSNWDSNFEEALSENASLTFVRPKWLFACNEKLKMVPYQPYIVVPAN